jgi:hypothetical protein
VDAIRWATAQAERSRAALNAGAQAPSPQQGGEGLARQNSNPFVEESTEGTDGARVNGNGRHPSAEPTETTEETLLAKLLQANTRLIEAFKMHDGELLRSASTEGL